MNIRLLIVVMLTALVVVTAGCGRRVRQAARQARPEAEQTEARDKPSGEEPRPVVPAAPKTLLAPMTPKPTIEETARALEEEKAAHARTRNDLVIATKRCAEAERDVQRLKASPKPAAETKDAASAADPAQQRLLALAREFYDAGKYEPARKVLEILMDLGHKGGYAYYMLARSYSELGRTDQAMDYYKMACDFYEPVDPKPKYYLYALNNLGTILRQEGRYREARVVYERAQFANPEYATAHYNLGVLYADYLNDKRRAIEHYQKYVDLKGERSAEALGRIHQLREDLSKEENK